MNSQHFRKELTNFAENYSNSNKFLFIRYNSAILFNQIQNNLFSNSYSAIINNTKWNKRLKKKHPQVKGHCELQSSNSSDALLMSIFAHPDLPKWKGMGNLLGTGRINNIDFGVKYKLKKSNNKEKKATEFDMVINNCYIFESKLTEKDFTNKNHKEVEKYDYFDNTFYKSFLKQTKRGYENYQIIRNILALQERFNRFVLLCDERRPDLIIRFYETVKCIRDISIRNKCKVITWQQVAFVCRKNLKKFLEQKYGING